MTPSDYLRVVVLPSLSDFLAAPDDQRRAYVACITTFHLGDYVARSGGPNQKGTRAAITGTDRYAACCLEIVEGICNGTKHAGPARDAAFKFAPGRERAVPAFALDTPGAGFDQGRWDRPGLVVGHRIADGTPGDGSYFIDDCVCVVVRAYVRAFPERFGGVDLGMISAALDRTAWLSAMAGAAGPAA